MRVLIACEFSGTIRDAFLALGHDAIVIPLTQQQSTIVDVIDGDLADLKWYAVFNPRYANGGAFTAARSAYLGNGRQKREYIHQAILARMLGRELLGKEEVDHIDLNPLNNCRSNLRLATRSENTSNQHLRSSNSSGFKGVSYKKETGRWAASITKHRKQRHLGYYGSAEEAYAAYCDASREIQGEFARTERRQLK